MTDDEIDQILTAAQMNATTGFPLNVNGKDVTASELIEMLGIGEEAEQRGWIFGDGGWQLP